MLFLFSGFVFGQDVNDYFKLDQHKTMKVSFKDSPIDIVLTAFMKETKITILKEPTIDTTVSIYSSKPMSYKNAFDALFSALKLSKIEASFENNLIVLRKQKQKNNTTQNFILPKELKIESYKLNFANAETLANNLNSLF